MSDAPVDSGRRAFFRRLVPDDAGRAGHRFAAVCRRAQWESTIESELRAFGTDVLTETARRTGVASATDRDVYADVARALAAAMQDTNDGRR